MKTTRAITNGDTLVYFCPVCDEKVEASLSSPSIVRHLSHNKRASGFIDQCTKSESDEYTFVYWVRD